MLGSSKLAIAKALRQSLVLMLLALSVSACASFRLPAVPTSEVKQVNTLGIPNERYVMDEMAPIALDAEFKRAGERELIYYRNKGQPLPAENFLTLSGGGDNGAFGAGLLVGWSQQGTRPKFKVVTGISTGALIAPFAFLGRDYDQGLTEVFTTIGPEDILEKRPILIGLTSDAAANSAPLFNLISKYLDSNMITEIAREYQRGRLLFVATTDLDIGRQVIWNIGALASSSHPDAPHLIRRILLASASVPGAFPPVMLDVTHGNSIYQEMHVDGGTLAQSFTYPTNNPKRIRNAYIIRNGQRWESQSEIERSAIPIAKRAISVLIDSNAIGDIYRVYTAAQRDKFEFNLALIESDFTAAHPEEFDHDYMVKLFNYGKTKGKAGYSWRKDPPGYKPENLAQYSKQKSSVDITKNYR